MVEQKPLGSDKESGGEAMQVGAGDASVAQSSPDSSNMKSPSRDIFGAEFNGTPSHQRVLKPPGGGSSDIFGTSGGSNESAATPARRVKNHQQSNLFLNDEPQMTPSRNQNDGTHNGQNGHSEEIVNANPVMNGNAAPIVNGNTQPAPAPAQRQRVPPGGFSSGLW